MKKGQITVIILLVVLIVVLGIILAVFISRQGKPFCGDENCDSNIGEDCLSCPEDCEDCSVEPVTEKSHFGVQGAIVNFPNEMKEAGIEITREWIEWSIIEPIDDQYDWTHMDKRMQAANQAGIEVLGYFTHMPSWAKKDKKCKSDFCEPKDWNDFREFARKVAERYDDKQEYGEIKYIGVLNEVTIPEFFDFKNQNNPYETWLINGYEGAKEGNPNVKVLIGAFVDPVGPEYKVVDKKLTMWIDRMLENYNQYYDIVNFHSYGTDDRGITQTIEYIKERMEYFSLNKPMWITETATLTFLEESDWQYKIARGVVKRYTRALREDIEKIFWFPFIGLPTPEEHPNGTESKTIALGWAFKEEDQIFRPRQAYHTYRLMTSKLTDFSSIEKISDTQCKFTFTNKDPVYVLWCDSGSCPIPSEITGIVKVTDYLGNREIKQASDIVLTEDPVFVE